MRATRSLVGLTGLLCCAGLLVGCGGGGGGGPTETAASLTEEGWVLYEDGEYEAAVVKFFSATELDANYRDAYNGLGWTYGKLDSLQKAVTNFELCLAKGDTRPDPHAGKAPVCRDLDPRECEEAISAAAAALSLDADFVFEHYEDFNWRDLRIIKAQCHFDLREYAEAAGEIEELGGGVIDPDSTARIAEKIEELEELYGG
ncbi:MAG: tetratricopeptide repeat protein [bacterium]